MIEIMSLRPSCCGSALGHRSIGRWEPDRLRRFGPEVASLVRLPPRPDLRG
ncbi:hypothetical protein BZL29_8175 [Mycobacterium kansasii]|uniref:Uncharacterized protein n=1 Tax=Mycobacterium kansasii TaxID=1768 RepID=A0A1V3WBI7_MYCKA|nr:hypothetical protein BZL29_8175 [Mycobacterium kansasii]